MYPGVRDDIVELRERGNLLNRRIALLDDESERLGAEAKALRGLVEAHHQAKCWNRYAVAQSAAVAELRHIPDSDSAARLAHVERLLRAVDACLSVAQPYQDDGRYRDGHYRVDARANMGKHQCLEGAARIEVDAAGNVYEGDLGGLLCNLFTSPPHTWDIDEWTTD